MNIACRGNWIRIPQGIAPTTTRFVALLQQI
jgi:hypothetical protein